MANEVGSAEGLCDFDAVVKLIEVLMKEEEWREKDKREKTKPCISSRKGRS